MGFYFREDGILFEMLSLELYNKLLYEKIECAAFKLNI